MPVPVSVDNTNSHLSDIGRTGYEVYVTEGNAHTICRCTTDTGTGIIRPCLGNMNWGGFRGKTCNAGSVDVIIRCGMNDFEPTPEPTVEPTEEGVVQHTFMMNGKNMQTIKSECGEFRQFRYDMPHEGTYTRVEMSSEGEGEPFVCDDPEVATRICQGVSKEETFSGVQCGDNYWSTGTCGSDTTMQHLSDIDEKGYEIHVTEDDSDFRICRCDTPDEVGVMRPCP